MGASSPPLALPLPPSVSASNLGYEPRTVCVEQTASTSVHSGTCNQVSDCLVLHCSSGPWQKEGESQIRSLLFFSGEAEGMRVVRGRREGAPKASWGEEG